MSAQFDHLVVGIRSLAEGTGQFTRQVGVEPAAGGSHPGRGTENALVSLGPGEYLEIIAPQAEAHLSDADAKLRELDRLTIVTWAISVDNADNARETLKAAGFATTVPQQGARVAPSGERLSWEVFRLSDLKVAGRRSSSSGARGRRTRRRRRRRGARESASGFRRRRPPACQPR